MTDAPQTVVAADSFMSDALSYLGQDLLDELIWHRAIHPMAGEVIPGTGGARKLRWTRPGMGKRGGTRTIYCLAGEDVPVFLIAIYAKGSKTDLTRAEKNFLKTYLPGWADRYRIGVEDG